MRSQEKMEWGSSIIQLKAWWRDRNVGKSELEAKGINFLNFRTQQ